MSESTPRFVYARDLRALGIDDAVQQQAQRVGLLVWDPEDRARPIGAWRCPDYDALLAWDALRRLTR